MIFDIFACIVERHFEQELRPLLEKASLFVFPGAAKDVLPRSIEPEILDFLRENFVLPFPVVAIEDASSCVVLYDLQKGQKGMRSDRGFVECLPMSADSATFREHGVMPRYDQMVEEMKSSLPEDAALITVGSISVVEPTSTAWLAQGRVEWQFVCTKKDMLIPPEAFEPYRHTEALLRSVLVNAMTAMEEIMYFNTPNRFILEEAPLDGNGGRIKIPRSHQRSRFTLLTPLEIRGRMRLPASLVKDNRKSPAGHERRRHYRTLRADRFRKMRGRTIVIPATWVGPSQVFVGRRAYRVRLDL